MNSRPVPSGVRVNNTMAVGYAIQDLHSSVNTKIETNNFTAGSIPKFDSKGYMDDSGKVPPSGEIVGTTDTQTLENKTLTSPVIDDFTNANHDHQDMDDAGQLDHGLALTGLSDDDHTQYVLADGTRDISFTTGDWSVGNITGGTKVDFGADGSIEADGDVTVGGDISVTGHLDSAECDSGSMLGLVVGKLPVYKSGVLQGYIPIYGSIT